MVSVYPREERKRGENGGHGRGLTVGEKIETAGDDRDKVGKGGI